MDFLSRLVGKIFIGTKLISFVRRFETTIPGKKPSSGKTYPRDTINSVFLYLPLGRGNIKKRREEDGL